MSRRSLQALIAAQRAAATPRTRTWDRQATAQRAGVATRRRFQTQLGVEAADGRCHYCHGPATTADPGAPAVLACAGCVAIAGARFLDDLTSRTRAVRKTLRRRGGLAPDRLPAGRGASLAAFPEGGHYTHSDPPPSEGSGDRLGARATSPPRPEYTAHLGLTRACVCGRSFVGNGYYRHRNRCRVYLEHPSGAPPEPKARPTQLGTWGNETQGRSERATRAAQKAHGQRAGLRLLDQIIGGTV